MAWGGGGGWGPSKTKHKGSSAWKDARNQERDPRDNQQNDGMGPYGRSAEPEKGFPLPEQPLWHGHAWQPEGVTYDQATGRFSDGYQPGPGDKPQF